MNNNLPKKYKSNIFNRVFIFIKNLLFRGKDTLVESKQETNFTNEKNNNFVGEIKTEINFKNMENEKYKFMENIKNNPELLENFTNDRLEIILKYFLDENNKKRNILRKLNA